MLHAWQGGNHAAFADLLGQVHADLKRMAASRIHGVESPSLAAGDLLHDSLLEVMGGAVPDWTDRGHSFATLSLAMRSA